MTERDMLWYVDRLRAPYTERHNQVFPDGRRKVTKVQHDGLLKQLRDSVYGGIGATGRSGTDPLARLPIDANALHLYERIENQIRWALERATHQPGHVSVEQTLTDWYVAHTNDVSRGLVSPDADDRAFHMVMGWVTAIDEHFNRPITFELTVTRTWEVDGEVRSTDYTGGVRTRIVTRTRSKKMPAPCPECRERYGTDESGARIFALHAEARETEPGVYGHLRAHCAACGHEWFGDLQVKELNRPRFSAASMRGAALV